MRVPLMLGAAVLAAVPFLGGAPTTSASAEAPAVQAPPAFAACAACHRTAPNAPAAMGPNLWKIGGRRAGSATFNYSPAMKGSKIVWNKQTLTAFVMNPRQAIPNNRMPYVGQRDPKAAAAIADYLMKLK